MRIDIPPPPRASWQSAPSQELTKRSGLQKTTAPISQPLDAGFLCRLYRSTLFLSVVFALSAYAVAQSRGLDGTQWGLSLIIGSAIGAALLKTQEWFVRRVFERDSLRPTWQRLAPILLLPGKYLLIGWALGSGIRHGWLVPVAFGLGFITVQVVIGAKVVGRLLQERVRTVHEVYQAKPKPPQSQLF